jgi:alcohol dehydrogenase
MGLVNTNPLAMLSRRIAEHKLPADQFLTHEFSFDQMLEAYDVFDGADTYEALKVLHQRPPG